MEEKIDEEKEAKADLIKDYPEDLGYKMKCKKEGCNREVKREIKEKINPYRERLKIGLCSICYMEHINFIYQNKMKGGKKKDGF